MYYNPTQERQRQSQAPLENELLNKYIKESDRQRERCRRDILLYDYSKVL